MPCTLELIKLRSSGRFTADSIFSFQGSGLRFVLLSFDDIIVHHQISNVLSYRLTIGLFIQFHFHHLTEHESKYNNYPISKNL
jgi:hypothetical protein